MSKQRDIDAGDTLASVETRSAKKARLAAVLDRGFTNYRLGLNYLAENQHGEWVRNDPTEIARLHALGFEVYKGEVDTSLGLKKESDGTVRVGDVILMVTDKETKALLDEVQQDRINRIHGIGTEQIEEKSFSSQVNGGIKSINESRIEEADASHILSAIKEN